VDKRDVERWTDEFFRMTGWSKREADRSSPVWSMIREKVAAVGSEKELAAAMDDIARRLSSADFVDRQAAVFDVLRIWAEAAEAEIFEREKVREKAETLAERLMFFVDVTEKAGQVLTKEQIARIAKDPSWFGGVKIDGGRMFSPEDVEALKMADKKVFEGMLEGLFYRNAGRMVSKAILRDEVVLPAYRNLIVRKYFGHPAAAARLGRPKEKPGNAKSGESLIQAVRKALPGRDVQA